MEYTYSTLRPKPLTRYQWESWLSDYPDHRMVLRRRTNKLIPTGRPNRVHYQIRCTCKEQVTPKDQWLSPGNARMQRIYIEDHINKVRRQGRLDESLH
jgi:hypothetical protein